MKISFHTRLASLMLAVGFFLSCSSPAPTIESFIEGNQYEEALNSIDSSLLENPGQPGLLIQKGEIYLTLASGELVENRDPYYTDAVDSFNEALEMDVTPAQVQAIDSHISENWQRELNTGTAIYEDESAPDRLSASIAHFNNAIILNPDDSRAYQSLSVAEYENQDLEGAINTLEEARESLSFVPESIYENLGFYYLQSGDPDQAIFYYELANTDISNNKNIAFGLVNAYITTSSVEKAIDLLGVLSENYPYDANIRNVYGTQLYHITMGILDDLNEAYLAGDSTLVSQLKFEAEGVGEQAEKELIEAYQLDNTDPEFVNSLAVFYNNLTAQYLSLNQIAYDGDKTDFENKASVLIDLAIQYYSELEPISPNAGEITAVLSALNQLKEIRFSEN